MLFLQKTTFISPLQRILFVFRLLALLSLLLAAAAARAASYYSSAAPTVATPTTCSLAITCGGVEVGTTAQLANQTLAANVYAAQTPVLVQLPLTGTAPAGYRAGMLVSSLGSLANLDLLKTATIRTYLDNVPQESQVVDLTALKASLLAGNGSPEQLEFTSTMPFNRVELELGSVTSLVGEGLKVQYAYGVAPTVARQVSGYVSRFANSAGQYDTGGCTSGISNADRAVDSDLTNYATFASILTVSCPEKLKVNLEGTSPAGYRAGFVVGGTTNLLSADLLGGVVLKTYKNGVLQETATGTSLLGLSVLPSGQSLVSFPSTKAFDAVSIERVGTATVLDNLQLYYGTGVATTPATQIRSNWSTATGHYQVSTSGVCALCSVTNPQNAADSDLNNATQIQVGIGVTNSVGLKVDLNGGGVAGNRAGMVIGRDAGDLLDASALSRIVLSTYDAAGNVLETHSGSSLLSLTLLPDGRQAVSFNTTRDFASVGIKIGGVATALDNTSIYYAFADDSNGTLSISPPVSPLPVTLVSLAVRRLEGSAEITWATASEVHSASFVVERASNPATGFVAVGQVGAAGSSVTTRQYSLRDAQAASLAGTLYYRLRQLDLDGTATLSSVVVLAADPVGTAFSLYPNPALAASSVTLGAAEGLPGGATASLYSSVGQPLSHYATPAEGQATLTITTAGLAPGLYYVVLRDAAGQTLTKQRLQVAAQ